MRPGLKLFRLWCCTTRTQNAILHDRLFRNDTLCWLWSSITDWTQKVLIHWNTYINWLYIRNQTSESVVESYVSSWISFHVAVTKNHNTFVVWSTFHASHARFYATFWSHKKSENNKRWNIHVVIETVWNKKWLTFIYVSKYISSRTLFSF